LIPGDLFKIVINVPIVIGTAAAESRPVRVLMRISSENRDAAKRGGH